MNSRGVKSRHPSITCWIFGLVVLMCISLVFRVATIQQKTPAKVHSQVMPVRPSFQDRRISVFRQTGG